MRKWVLTSERSEAPGKAGEGRKLFCGKHVFGFVFTECSVKWEQRGLDADWKGLKAWRGV